MMNLIAFVLCGGLSIWFAIDKKIGFCITEAALALLNLPFAIQWIASLF